MLGAATLLAGCSTFDSLTGSGGDEPAQSDIPTALIVDGSGSMNTDDASGTRIDAAKTAAGAYIDALPDGTDFSLWTYGLNTSDSEADHDAGCRDTTNLIDSGDVDRDAAKNAVNGIAPRGWSPIAATMKQAGESLPTDVEASLVVVTDGEDHCGRPTICEVAEQLHESHPMLRIDAIGFMIDDDELNCAATTTGGLYVTADNTEQLTSRLAASRDAELSKTTLTGRSFQGIEIGAAHSDIAAGYDDFPALDDGEETQCTSGDCGSDTITIVNWRDCDWHFTEDGFLYLIDPGESARTIDGFGVGDDADELATFYGDVIEESTGTLDGDDVTIRWYEADADLGLAWRVVIDADDKIRAIVLCRCLPGSTPPPADGSGRISGGDEGADAGAGAGAGNDRSGGDATTRASGGGDHTEVLVFDVFEDDGSVREPFLDVVVDKSDPREVVCKSDPDPGTSLHECGQYQTDWTVGRCSIDGTNAYCPVVDSAGEFSIEKYAFGQYYEAGNPPEFDEALPTAVVDMDGTVYVRGMIFGLADYRYLDVDSARSASNSSTGLRAPNGAFPLDKSKPRWTAQFARGYDANIDRKTIDVKRVYYFE